MVAGFVHLLGKFCIVCNFGPVDKGPSLQVSGLHPSKSDDQLTLFVVFKLGCWNNFFWYPGRSVSD